MLNRLPISTFKIPIDDIRNGYYSDKYFIRTKEILEKDNYDHSIDFQYFMRKNGIVCGIDEAIAIIKTCTGYYKQKSKNQVDMIYNALTKTKLELRKINLTEKWDEWKLLKDKEIDLIKNLRSEWIDKSNDIEIYAIKDGERVKEGEIILGIKGNPKYYAHLETITLGVISRASSTCTSVKDVVNATDKPILFFPARFDHYRVQATDGYAALKAGAFGVSTDSNADYWGSEGLGTIPHLLIGCYNGDTAKAAIKFDKSIDEKVNRIVLVDWDNDCINTTLNVIHDMILDSHGDELLYEYSTDVLESEIKEYGNEVIGSGKNKLWGVRFDTSGSNIDRSVKHYSCDTFGVCPDLVFEARRKFDSMGLQNLKIVVSGGFDVKKIELFEKMNAPVDVYGVGSSLLKNKIDITADICKLDGKECSKVGRGSKSWERLSLVNFK